MAPDDGYLLDNAQPPAGARFAALTEIFDPSTFRHLTALGVAEGWHCWEVGAGGRSVPAWLAARTGPRGRVLATDIDLTWLDLPGPDGPAPDSLEIRTHDVGTEPPPATGLDLVHARLVLTHVPQRDRALASMVAALRPGGRLLVEEADPALQPLLCPEDRTREEQLANRLRRGFRSLMAERAADLAYGRTLPRRLREHGLAEVGADACFPISAPACTALERATVVQIRDQLIRHGIATAAEIDQHLHNLDSGRLPDLATSPMVSAWGRKP